MGPYFIPRVGRRRQPSGFKCSWYAPGASGGVNIDGGAAADPETGKIYVAAQSGLSTMQRPEGSVLGVPLQLAARQLRPARRAAAAAGLQEAGGDRSAASSAVPAASTIGGVSIVKPKELGGITAYDMNTGDKAWWIPNGGSSCRSTSDGSAVQGREAAAAPRRRAARRR